jgi:Bardet-Biedl syndrome 7 protein
VACKLLFFFKLFKTVYSQIVLCKEESCYLVSIEAPTSLEFVVLQCDVPIELVDMEKYAANMSYGEVDALVSSVIEGPTFCRLTVFLFLQNNNFLLATYRCPADTNRVEFKFRSIEGQHGTLQLYITPNLQPKCCELKRFPIRPLALHMRTHSFDEKR